MSRRRNNECGSSMHTAQLMVAAVLVAVVIIMVTAVAEIMLVAAAETTVVNWLVHRQTGPGSAETAHSGQA